MPDAHLACLAQRRAPLGLTVQRLWRQGLTQWLGLSFWQWFHVALGFDVISSWKGDIRSGPEAYHGEGAHVWTSAAWRGTCVAACDALLPRRVAGEVLAGTAVDVHGFDAAHSSFQGTLANFA